MVECCLVKSFSWTVHNVLLEATLFVCCLQVSYLYIDGSVNLLAEGKVESSWLSVTAQEEPPSVSILLQGMYSNSILICEYEAMEHTHSSYFIKQDFFRSVLSSLKSCIKTYNVAER